MTYDFTPHGFTQDAPNYWIKGDVVIQTSASFGREA